MRTAQAAAAEAVRAAAAAVAVAAAAEAAAPPRAAVRMQADGCRLSRLCSWHCGSGVSGMRSSDAARAAVSNQKRAWATFAAAISSAADATLARACAGAVVRRPRRRDGACAEAGRCSAPTRFPCGKSGQQRRAAAVAVLCSPSPHNKLLRQRLGQRLQFDVIEGARSTSAGVFYRLSAPWRSLCTTRGCWR